jgi:hypothetical protein
VEDRGHTCIGVWHFGILGDKRIMEESRNSETRRSHSYSVEGEDRWHRGSGIGDPTSVSSMHFYFTNSEILNWKRTVVSWLAVACERVAGGG